MWVTGETRGEELRESMPTLLSSQCFCKLKKKKNSPLIKAQASLVAQLVKHPTAMQETPVQFLGQEDPLEKGYATHSSIHGLPWWLR